MSTITWYNASNAGPGSAVTSVAGKIGDVTLVESDIGSLATDIVRLRKNCFNVLDYGADPTGVSDSTSAFQSAITAAGVSGTIYAPGGTSAPNQYKITTGLVPGIRTRFVGDGVDATWLITSTGSSPAISYLGTGTVGSPENGWCRGNRIEGFSVYHTGSAPAIQMNMMIHGIWEHVHLHGNSTSTATSYGFRTIDSYEHTFRHCRAYSFGLSGFKIESTGGTQPGQLLYDNCDSGYHGASGYPWEYNIASGIVDSCDHRSCVSINQNSGAAGVALLGAGGIRNFDFSRHHFQDTGASNTKYGIHAGGSDIVGLYVKGFYFGIGTPIHLSGTVHGVELSGQILKGNITASLTHALVTNSNVEGLSIGWIRNFNSYPGYDGLASGTVDNPFGF